jgi:tRNA modification GTPase
MAWVMRDPDTIVALSSGTLPSGVAVIRLSGPRSGLLLRELTGGSQPPRRLTLRTLSIEGSPIDTGLVAWFPGPNSFTGEDCAELQVHGSPVVVRTLLRHLADHEDTRLAEAGEFTRRAFENGKLDLTEVEGLGDLIAAETESQRRQALARLGGGLTRQLEGWRTRLLDLRAEIEAQLDFSDEGDVGALPVNFAGDLTALREELLDAAESVARGRVVREGLRVALAGPPNAGKSSLLNSLARSDLAIVTDEPGTTRDVREVAIDLGGHFVLLIDMAGLRETSSKAEAEGVRRAREELSRADLVLWLSAPDAPAAKAPAEGPLWRIATKVDLEPPTGARDLAISTVTGAGLEDLIERLTLFAAEAAGDGEPALVSRERDLAGLQGAAQALAEAQTQLAQSELAAESVRRASHALERMLGTMDAESVLDRLFLNFCIGK